MTITYRTISEFMQAASAWLTDNPTGHEKFSYALKKVTKQGREKFRGYEEAIEDIQITHSAVDDRGVILRNDKNELQYTPEGLKARNAEIRAKWASKVDGFKTHFVADENLPELSEEYREAFAGFVFADDGFKIEMVKPQSDEASDFIYDIVTDQKIAKKDRQVEAVG